MFFLERQVFLLPPVPNADQFISLLLRGHFPDRWPENWRFFAAAIEGKSEDEVLTLLPEGPEAAYNRFILDPQTYTYTLAKEMLPDDFSLLLDAAAWRLKLYETPHRLAIRQEKYGRFYWQLKRTTRFNEKIGRLGFRYFLKPPLQ